MNLPARWFTLHRQHWWWRKNIKKYENQIQNLDGNLTAIPLINNQNEVETAVQALTEDINWTSECPRSKNKKYGEIMDNLKNLILRKPESEEQTKKSQKPWTHQIEKTPAVPKYPEEAALEPAEDRWPIPPLHGEGVIVIVFTTPTSLKHS